MQDIWAKSCAVEGEVIAETVDIPGGLFYLLFIADIQFILFALILDNVLVPTFSFYLTFYLISMIVNAIVIGSRVTIRLLAFS